MSNELEQLNNIEQQSAENTEAAVGTNRRKLFNRILTVALLLMIVFFVSVVLVRCFLFSRITVSGESMMPNFRNGETYIVDKREKAKQNVQRGDVVVLFKNYVPNAFLAEFPIVKSEYDDAYDKLIKRVVALGGDKLWVEEKDSEYILVIQTPDGQILYEDYYVKDGEPAHFFSAAQFEQWKILDKEEYGDVAYLGNELKLGKLAGTSAEKPFFVREGYFFFLGDNRHDSNDSRALGVVQLHRLYGVVKQK